MIDLIYIIAGLVLMIKGADVLTNSSSLFAKKFNVSELVIGMTIIAFGTSAPELIINIIASANGNSEIAIANILGSNIANILLVLGISGIIYPLTIKKEIVWKEIPLSLIAAIIIGFMANDALFYGTPSSQLSTTDGLILLLCFMAFLYDIYFSTKNNNLPELEERDKKTGSLIFLMMIGLFGLLVGGEIVVSNSINLTLLWGISQSLVGLTIVAVGTSLPELFTSVVSAYKGKADIAIGNIIGSNIFNIFWILGISSAIKPIPFSSINNIDILMTISASSLLFLFMFIGKKHTLERWQSGVLLIIYFIYIYTIMIRG